MTTLRFCVIIRQKGFILFPFREVYMPSTSKNFSEEKNEFLRNEEAFRKRARDAQEAHNLELRRHAITERVQVEIQNETREADNEYKENVKVFEEVYRNLKPFQGYESVLSILLQLLNFYTKLAPLVRYNFGEAYKELPVVSHLDAFAKSAKVYLKVQKELWAADDPGPVVLPVITHKVNLDKDGKLDMKPLHFLQDVVTKVKLSPEDFDALNTDFLKVVNGWLMLHEHKPAYRVKEDDNKVYRYDVDTQEFGNKALTKKEFEDLRDAPFTGLTAYMQKNLGMQSELTLEENPTPKPTFK